MRDTFTFLLFPETSKDAPYFVQANEQQNILEIPPNTHYSASRSGSTKIQHTYGHRDCPACAPSRGGMRPEVAARLSFSELADYWWAIKKPTLAIPTQQNYDWYMRNLAEAPFWTRPIEEAEWSDIDGYRNWRMNTPQGRLVTGVGPSVVNHEIDCVIKPLLKLAGRWPEFAFVYKRLPAQSKKRRFLSFEEEQFFFEIASQQADWRVAYLATSIMNNTGATKLEMRHVRLCDVDFEKEEMRITTVKPHCPARIRTVGLNTTCLKQMLRLIEIAVTFKGASKPEHHLFPFRVNRRKWDPERPASTSFIRSQLEHLRAYVYQAWCEKFKDDPKRLLQGEVFKHLSPHMFRHQFCTNSDEAGVPSPVLCAAMGWTGDAMLRIYRHVRQEQQAAIPQRLEQWRDQQRKNMASAEVIRSKHMRA